MTRVHSWYHSYPHAKRTKGFNQYIEVEGLKRTWTNLAHLKRDTKNKYVLVYRGCLGIWEVVDAVPVDCT